MPAFETVIPVRFGHVDYAGIMFYPRFFDNFHAVFEDMFGARLGVPYMSILKDRRIGFPTVGIETRFRRPFRFGEPMRLRILNVLMEGERSVNALVEATEAEARVANVPPLEQHFRRLSWIARQRGDTALADQLRKRSEKSKASISRIAREAS